MKIAFVYGPISIGPRPIDFGSELEGTLERSSRGLTGSELSCIQVALACARRGHEVWFYTVQPEGSPTRRRWRGLELCTIEQRCSIDASFDAVCAWNEPDMLRGMPVSAVRLVNQQLNDFMYCAPDFDAAVDVYTSPSADHLKFIAPQTPSPGKWLVFPNGCDPAAYPEVDRIPGRVIWASSADRGLHLLLQAWPVIKYAVPHASLRCFYNFNYGELEKFEGDGVHVDDMYEVAQRVRYIKYAVERLRDFDVEHVGSVSREQIAREFSQSVVLGYPCETVRYSEGFSVTTMEACASGVLPVIGAADALGHIYGEVVPTVPFPPSQHMGEFCELVVRGLTDVAWRSEWTQKSRAFARGFSWDILAEKFEDILEQARAAKGLAA